MKSSAILLGFILAALSAGRAAALETDYGAGALALPLEQAQGTARSMALGSAVVAVPDGSASLLWNPAGLGLMCCTDVGLHTDEGLGNTFQETAVLGLPLGHVADDGRGGSLGGLAVALGYVNYGSFEGRDATGLPTGNYQAAGFSGSLGWGYQLLPGVSAGADIKADQSDFGGQNYNSYAADLGLLWTIVPTVNLGATYSNIDLGDRVGGSILASGWRLGAAWTPDPHLLFAVQGELQNHEVNTVQGGAEYRIGNVAEKVNVLSLRVGYEANYPNPQLSGLTGLTFGLGYTLTKALALDYGFITDGDLGNQQFLSLTFTFDCPQKPAPRPPDVVFQSIALGDELFDFDKSTLKPEGMAVLRETILAMKQNPKTQLRVAGYTSMSGTAEYNQLLSERRAAAVEAFLVSEGGIAPDRIKSVGYGATDPATYEAHPGDINSAAAQSNRRVLFEVTIQHP